MFFCVVFFFCVFFFYFIKISKFALPGVMLIYERTSKDRKKERAQWLSGRVLDSRPRAVVRASPASLRCGP